jgi:hypothetical protein
MLKTAAWSVPTHHKFAFLLQDLFGTDHPSTSTEGTARPDDAEIGNMA